MKKRILIAAFIAAGGMSLFLNGCKKDAGDTTAPVITLSGNTSYTISLNGSAFSDPGATATDDKDGTVTVTSDESSTNPNVNRVNTYTITYTATDAAGNTSHATRTVRVKNDAENYVGTYNVVDSGGTSVYTYTQTITVDETQNNRIHFNKWANFANNTNIYAVVRTSDGNFDIPSQAAASIGSGSASCDISDHNFVSNAPGSTVILNGFMVAYTDQVTSPSACTGSATYRAYFTK